MTRHNRILCLEIAYNRINLRVNLTLVG